MRAADRVGGDLEVGDVDGLVDADLDVGVLAAMVGADRPRVAPGQAVVGRAPEADASRAVGARRDRVDVPVALRVEDEAAGAEMHAVEEDRGVTNLVRSRERALASDAQGSQLPQRDRAHEIAADLVAREHRAVHHDHVEARRAESARAGGPRGPASDDDGVRGDHR